MLPTALITKNTGDNTLPHGHLASDDGSLQRRIAHLLFGDSDIATWYNWKRG